jgi:hypothetical protein
MLQQLWQLLKHCQQRSERNTMAARAAPQPGPGQQRQLLGSIIPPPDIVAAATLVRLLPAQQLPLRSKCGSMAAVRCALSFACALCGMRH